MRGLENKIGEAARKVAAFILGGLLATVGVGFLTAASWFALTETQSQVFAATVIGLVYLGVGAVAIGIGTMSRRATPRSELTGQHGDLSPMQTVAVSFLQGLEQGRQTRRAR